MNFSTEKKYQQLLNIVPSVSRETMENLIQFESLILQWNAHINLISATTIPDLWTRHILDSAQIFPLYAHSLHWCDLGSGGGFPAIVIAIFLKEKKQHILILLKVMGKKLLFCEQLLLNLIFQQRFITLELKIYIKKFPYLIL